LKVERPKPPPLLLPFLSGRQELRTKGAALDHEEEERVWSKFFQGQLTKRTISDNSFVGAVLLIEPPMEIMDLQRRLTKDNRPLK